MKSIFLFKSRGIEGIPVIIRFKTHLHHLISFRIYGIEGIPVIIRFKTASLRKLPAPVKADGIEGIPVIIRFKTSVSLCIPTSFCPKRGIEGIPVIIRFKTRYTKLVINIINEVLKVFQL